MKALCSIVRHNMIGSKTYTSNEKYIDDCGTWKNRILELNIFQLYFRQTRGENLDRNL